MTTMIAERIKKLSDELNILQNEMHLVADELQAADDAAVQDNAPPQQPNQQEECKDEKASNKKLKTINQELQLRNDTLAESDSYTKAILDTIHEPMVILNDSLQVRSSNNLFRQTFNPGNKELKGVSIFEIIDRQWDFAQLHKFLEGDLKSADFRSIKIVHTFPQIGRKVMLLNASRIAQRRNREQLILLAIQDITELAGKDEVEKELLYKNIREEEQQNAYLESTVKDRTKEIEETRKILKNKSVELEIANKDLTSFTYVSSHDLQEPLRKIQVFADLLLSEEKNLSRNGKTLFRRLQNTAKRMQMLLADLLSYSLTKRDGQFETIHLNTVIDQLKLDFDELIKEYDAKIEVVGLCEANIMPFQFSVLLNNLIHNALRFSHPDRQPHILISCKIEHVSQLKEPLLNNDIEYYCHVSVEDNGIGFDNQYRERIFDVFERLDGQSDSPGTGIGLAICRRIVENHNGIITASGTVDKGARFDIYIPTSQEGARETS